jgi:hypothetical protein
MNICISAYTLTRETEDPQKVLSVFSLSHRIDKCHSYTYDVQSLQYYTISIFSFVLDCRV